MEITTADIRGYLATLQPEEEAGVVCDIGECLVARALHWKYPSVWFGVGTAGFWSSEQDSKVFPMSAEVQEVRMEFDSTTFGTRTRKDVEESIPVLRGE